jgi:hypothetical protein
MQISNFNLTLASHESTYAVLGVFFGRFVEPSASHDSLTDDSLIYDSLIYDSLIYDSEDRKPMNVSAPLNLSGITTSPVSA